MNHNVILAILVSRNIITLAEGERIAEHIAHKPQSTYLQDSVREVDAILNPLPVANVPVNPHAGPEQQAEQANAATIPRTVPQNEKTEEELDSQAADSTAGAMDSPAATGMSNATEAVGQEGAPVEDVSNKEVKSEPKPEAKPSKSKKAAAKKSTDNSEKK